MILSTVFEEQSVKWEPLTLQHISRVIALVHDFIAKVFRHLCPEGAIRMELWNAFVVEKLCECYRHALYQARFLLSMERDARPSTFNDYFSDMLQQKRGKRMSKVLESSVVEFGNKHPNRYVPLDKVRAISSSKSNDDQACEDIFDVTESYYKVAQKRYVDTLFQQAVSYHLLEGAPSPFNVFSSAFVMSLDDDMLEVVVGEDEDSKQRRTALNREEASLATALKVL